MKIRVLLAASLLIVMCISAVYADGVFIAKPPRTDPNSHARDITEPEQKGVILHFNGRERLILQVSYKGEASEFAWLVPTPSLPSVTKFDQPIFHRLQRLTAPHVRYWFDADERLSTGHYKSALMGASRAEPPLQVDVIERKTTGVYDVAILRARDENDLLKWLKTNGYQVNNELKDILKDYIKRDWIFTASRIDTSKQKSVGNRLKEGVLQSLQYDFKSEKPVYPLFISSLNPGRTKVLLYTFADHRLTSDTLKTNCGWMGNVSGWKHLAAGSRSGTSPFDSLIDPKHIDHKVYMTKLEGDLSKKQMQHDLIFQQASDDTTIDPKPMSPPVMENIGATYLLLGFSTHAFVFICWLSSISLIISFKLRKSLTAWTATFSTFVLVLTPIVFGTYNTFSTPDYRSLYVPVGVTVTVALAGVLFGIVFDVYRRIGRKAKRALA